MRGGTRSESGEKARSEAQHRARRSRDQHWASPPRRAGRCCSSAHAPRRRGAISRATPPCRTRPSWRGHRQPVARGRQRGEAEAQWMLDLPLYPLLLLELASAASAAQLLSSASAAFFSAAQRAAATGSSQGDAERKAGERRARRSIQEVGGRDDAAAARRRSVDSCCSGVLDSRRALLRFPAARRRAP
jgi:hypothetical protein